MGRYPEHGEKVCLACGQKKAFAAFYRRQNLTDGRMDVCIVCFKAKFPTKVCNTCHIVQPLDAFPVHPSSADGHKYTCSTCLGQQRVQQQDARIQYRIDERKHKIASLQNPRYGHPSALWARDICALPNAVVLDTETTGFGLDAEIIDLGIISIDGKKLVNQLIQCQVAEIPADATRVHHITKAMLAQAPTFPQIWKKLMERLETYVIIIYNADFDRQMLEQTARRYKLPMPKLEIHCMMKPVAAYIGGPKQAYKLETACQHFHVENMNAHRAFADAQASQQVLQALAQMAAVPEQGKNIPILHVTPINGSAMQLKEALDLYGEATNHNHAWGYSPDPMAKRLEDGTIKVTTYHMESEWQEHTFATPEEVDFYLYTEGSAVCASLDGKRFDARLVIEETGFSLSCTIDGQSVSPEEYSRIFPQEFKEDGEWLPHYWDGPGEWDKE